MKKLSIQKMSDLKEGLNRVGDKIREKVWNPKISQDEFEEKLKEIKQKLPIPIFWLLGKTQSGKTSIVRFISGSTEAEIGNGFQPCTKSARLYEFPTKEDCFIRFLDTRGLGEVDYDPKEDMAIFSQQAHLLIVVIKAMDQVQENLLKIVRQIAKEHPKWRIIVAQTHLHEGYPANQSSHLIPYPYSQVPFPHTVPKDLARSLLKQRELFKDIPAQFIPIDFTLPEDGFSPVDYGLDALWEAIETALPLGLQSMIKESEYQKQHQDIFAQKAHPHIISYAILAGGVGALPVPVIPLPFIVLLQTKMFHSIASIYGQEINKRLISEIFGCLGVSGFLWLGLREIIIKLVPGYGSIVSSLSAAAVTYALGKTSCAYFNYTRQGNIVDTKILKKIYADELIKGREILSNYIKNVAHAHAHAH